MVEYICKVNKSDSIPFESHKKVCNIDISLSDEQVEVR